MPKALLILACLIYGGHGGQMHSHFSSNLLVHVNHLQSKIQLRSLRALVHCLLMFKTAVSFNPSTLHSRFSELINSRSRTVLWNAGCVASVKSMDDAAAPNEQVTSFPALRPLVAHRQIVPAMPIFNGSAMMPLLTINIGSDALNVKLLHGELLPEIYSSQIPLSDEQIIKFMLAYLEHEGLEHVTLFINGGYVRDLLMGNEPVDLDLSLDLRGCSRNATVQSLLEKLPEFAEQRPDLGIVFVNIKFNMNKEAEAKNIDSFKAFFHNNQGQKVEIDVLPTCGDEQYEVGSRIPYRNWRASPQEDTLRRDLTVGAMLLKVEKPASGMSTLSYRLLDFYGGIADLAAGVLQAPIPKGTSYEFLSSIVLQTETQRELANALEFSSRPEQEAVQILWWAKALMDDPIRVCRALRFSATLRGFELHRAFWDAVPFALLALHSSIAGRRKTDEYVKVAADSYEACVYFIESAFTITFGPSKPLTLRDSGLHGELTLAASLFGGRTDQGDSKSLPEHRGFDVAAFRTMAAALAPTGGHAAEPDELLGGLLLAAIASASGLECSVGEFESMCDGMQSPKAMRNAGSSVLGAVRGWVGELEAPSLLVSGFANACGVSSEDMHLYSLVWHDLGLPGSSTKPAWSFARRDLALKLAQRFATQGEASTPHRLDRVAEALWIVTLSRPSVKGRIFDAPDIVNVDPKLRKQVMTLLEVATRLLRYDAPLESSEDMKVLLSKYPKLQAAFSQHNVDFPPPSLSELEKLIKSK